MADSIEEQIKRAQAEYDAIDRDYRTMKQQRGGMLDSNDPSVAAIQKRRDDAETKLEDLLAKRH